MKTPYIKIPDHVFEVSAETKRLMEQWRDLYQTPPFIPPWAGAYSAILQSPNAALVGDGYDALRLEFGWPTLPDLDFDNGVATMNVSFNYGDTDAATN
ncbi:hypothetical protein [Rhizobium phage RHEph12]|nr:hypothetical protein [Rhizobium phage RHEph12]